MGMFMHLAAMTRIALAAVIMLCMPGWASAFHVEEHLRYELSWGILTAGTSSLEIYRDEQGVLRMVSTARSADWITVFYPVEDRVESVVEDERPWYPIWYHLKTREGRRRKDKEVFFIRESGQALYVDRLNGEEEHHDVPAEVFDPLSAFYHVRYVDLEVGTSAYVPVFDSKRVWDVQVEVLKKERVKVPAGTFETVLIRPHLKSEGIFSRKGPIYIWLTDDERRIPVKMKTEVAVGSIIARLLESTYPEKEALPRASGGASETDSADGVPSASESAPPAPQAPLDGPAHGGI